MKTPLLFLCLFVISFSLKAQYISFPEANAKWSTKIDHYNNPDDVFSTYKTGYAHEIINDTIIDGINYQKLYQRKTWSKTDYFQETDDGQIIEYHEAYNISANPILIGALRQDTFLKKVYFRRFIQTISNISCIEPVSDSDLPLNEDIILFDFEAEVGDTVYVGGNNKPYYINQIDSIQYNDGVFRKRLLAGNSFPSFYFIEGLGTSNGLFAPIRGDFVEGHFCELACFSIDDNYIIGDGIYNCDSIDFVSALVEIEEELSLNIFPNPFRDYLQIDSKITYGKTFQLYIYNSLGKLMIEKTLDSFESFNLNTSHLPTGIYLISVFDNTTLLSTKKITKI